MNRRHAKNAFSYLSIVPANHTAASVTMVASSTMITLKPSTPVVKASRHSGDMLNDVTCWKSAWPWPRDANRNSAAANVKTDAASAVFRAGAPSMIKTAATTGQKIVNRTIRKNDEARMSNDEGMMKLE